MAIAYRSAVVSFIEELADDSIPQARSCEDEEFLLFLLISYVRIENSFERSIRLYSFRLSFSDVKNYTQLFETPVSYLPKSVSRT